MIRRRTNGKFKARLPGDTSNKRIDDIGNYERKEKAAVRDFKAHPWNGNEASQADYVVQQWKLFNEQGFINAPISNYKFEKDKLENMNPQKLFNYILQNLETSTNIGIHPQT